MRTLFGNDDVRIGFVMLFACREGSDCTQCDADCRRITARARVFTTDAEGKTYGQLVPGVPSQSLHGPDDRVFLTGIRQTGAFRTNVGLLNASEQAETTLRLRLHDASGERGVYEQRLPPLAFVQGSVAAMFPGFTGEGWIAIESGSMAPFLAFASMIDNASNDPVYLESQVEGAR